ncbi:pilus assembly PilX N-terminal domain-containing protein [Neobacillus sp. D3-1R]|uniref:pilus assembly PilX N-terminal domain-containing protein n=1 Tax=Neobacillus sp. D3-1R TaxID=3445778 RepID=UPI003F9F0CEF
MKKINNQQGNTLLLVLMIMTVFTLLFISLMGQTLSNTKQLSKTEEDFQAVSLAEMGVIYYKTAIDTSLNSLMSDQDELNKIYQLLGQKVIQDFGEITKDKIELIKTALKTDPSYSEFVTSEWLKRINDPNYFPAIDYLVDIDSASHSAFQIQDIIASNNSKEITYKFISKGINDEKSVNLATEINIPFSGIEINLSSEDEGSGGGSGGSGGSEDIPSGNDISNPGNLPTCGPEQTDFSNSDCQMTGEITFDNNDKVVFSNTTLKINGSLTLAKSENNAATDDSTLYISGNLTALNMNSLDRLNLHVGGSANFKNLTGDALNNSIIEIGGNASFKNIKPVLSKMYIGGKADIENINEMEKSFIFVNSDASINSIQLGNNSTVCVKGHLNLDNQILFKGTNSHVYALSSNNTSVVTDQEAYNNACSSDLVQKEFDFVINWDAPSPSTEYDYKY